MLDVMNSGVFLADLGRFPSYDGGRRHSLAGVELSAPALAAYNETLHRICPAARDVQADQIASIGRTLLGAFAAGGSSQYVQARIAGVQVLVSMRADRRWRLADGLEPRIAALLDYVDDPEDLIPDPTPAVGLLDDAILVDLLSRDIAPELGDYQDFCAWRLQLAALRQLPPEALDVDMDQWLWARCRDQAAQRDRLRLGYAPQARLQSFRVA